MTMKLSQIKTHWTADEAYLVISFLDELRDLVWESYADEIIAAEQARVDEARQTDLMFDDDIEF